MIYVIYALVAVVSFLLVFNGFPRGASKAEINIFLRVVLLGLMFAVFFLAGWISTLISLVIAVVFAVCGRPVAARTASRIYALTSGRKGQYVGLPSWHIERLSHILAAPISPTWAYGPRRLLRFRLARGLDRICNWFIWAHRNTLCDSKTNAEEALLDYCEQQPSLRRVLRKFDASREEIRRIYRQLIREGAGQWCCGHFVPVSTLTYPEALRYTLIRRGRNDTETAFNLMMYFERGWPLDLSGSVQTDRISFNEFIGQIEELFGTALTLRATEAATDFWNNWTSFTDLIVSRQLSVQVDPFFLVHNFPQYGRYHTWKGTGIVLLLLGLAVVWFFWPLGVGLLTGGVGLRVYGNRVRFNDAKAFAEEVMKEATLNPGREGYARLFAHYVAGIIALVSPTGSAHWPQHPSNAITGEQTFIETTRDQQSH